MKNYTYGSDLDAVSISSLLKKLKKCLVLMLVAALVLGFAGYAVSDETTRYSCSFTAVVTSLEPSSTPQELNNNLSFLKTNVKTFAALLTGSELLTAAEAASDFEVPPANVKNMVSVSSDANTGFITVTVNAETAADAENLLRNIAALSPQYLADILPGCTMQLVSDFESSSSVVGNGSRNAAIGAFLGILLVAGTVVLREMILCKVTECEVLEETFFLPVLGRVQNAEEHTKWRLRAADFEAFRLKESSPQVKRDGYCALRTNLMAALKDGANCVGFSSGADQDGKSTSVINLALSLSQIGKRVLLIDADLRAGSVSDKLGFAGCAGLSQVLSGDQSLDACVRSISDGLTLLPAGELLPTSSDLLSEENATLLVQNAKQAYDYVLIDLPAVQSAPDAAIAARYTDGMLLVVRHDHSRIRQVLEAVRAMDFVDASVLGFLYTDAPSK